MDPGGHTMTIPELNRGSSWFLPLILAAMIIGFLAEVVRGETRTVFGIGGGEGSGQVVDDFKVVLFHTDFDLFTQLERDVPLDGWVTISGGKGDGAFGKVELVTFAAGIEWQPTHWEGFEIGGGYRAATARLDDINLGPGVRPVGLLEQYLGRVSLNWEDAALGLSWTHLWSSPAPEKLIADDVCGRWTGIQVCGSWTNRGSSWVGMLVWEVGTRLELPWRKR